MSECPFCKAEVSEDTTRFGGHCTSCLIEIPGEEAATNPGEGGAVEPVQAASLGPLISGIVAAVVVLAAVGAWYLQQAGPVVQGARANLNTHVPLSAHENQEYRNETPHASSGEEQAQLGRESSHRRNRTGGQAPEGGQAIAEGRVVPKQAPLGNPLDAFAMGAGPNVKGPKGIVLNDVGQIRSMAMRVLQKGNKRLEPCYQQKNSVQPSYAGRWRLTVDINREGEVADLELTPLSGADSDMARCIKSHVKRWTFRRIAEPVSVSYEYRFGN
jgi:hypothetical protein